MPSPQEPPLSQVKNLSHGPRQNYTTEGRAVRVESEEELRRLPPGSFRLSRREIIKAAERYKLRKEGKAWRQLENTWPIYSGFACIATSCYIISVVRHKFKLGRYHARGIQYISASAFPSLFVPVGFIPLIGDPAIIKEVDCPDCLGIRGGLIQFTGGVIWAASLASIGALYYAKRYHTVPLPPISLRYARDYAKILSQPYKPVLPMMLYHSMFQFVVGYIGGIKYWYRGQELNFTEYYVGQKSREIYGFDMPYPEFTRGSRVETDWLTETIGSSSWSKLFGRAVAADTDDDEEEEDERDFLNIGIDYVKGYGRKVYEFVMGSK